MTRSTTKQWCWGLVLLVFAMGLVAACDDDTPSSPDPAELALTFSPDPVPAQSSSRVDTDGVPFDWRASFRVNVTELEGVAGTITSTSAVVHEAAGGIIVGTPDQSEDVVVSAEASRNRLEGFGTTTIDFDIDYRFASGGREALIDVTVTVQGDDEDDDDIADFTVSETETVSVR